MSTLSSNSIPEPFLPCLSGEETRWHLLRAMMHISLFTRQCNQSHCQPTPTGSPTRLCGSPPPPPSSCLSDLEGQTHPHLGGAEVWNQSIAWGKGRQTKEQEIREGMKEAAGKP